MASNDQKNQAREKREQLQAAAAAAEKRQRNLQILAGVVFAAVAVVIVVIIALGGTGEKNTTNAKGDIEGVAETKTLLAGIDQDGLTLGKKTAPLTVVEFLDVQCPFCKDHQLDEQPAVITNLVRTGKAKLEMQPLAFLGTDSERGRTVLLRLAEQDKAWNFVNLFYWNQGTERSGYATDDYLKKLVAGVPGTKAADASTKASASVTAKAAAIDKAAASLGVSGTPTFFVGKTGAPLSTYKKVEVTDPTQDAEAITEAVDSAN